MGHVDDEPCHHPKTARADELPVREVMVARPKTLPASATVADVRRMFENPHVETALLVDGTAFAGAIDRDDVPPSASDAAPALDLVNQAIPTARADASVRDAMAVLDPSDGRRLVILADDGRTLAGLLCLDAPRTGFCGT